jgi:hypothetical protein
MLTMDADMLVLISTSGPTGPLTRVPDRGSPPNEVASPRRAAPYKGVGATKSNNPVRVSAHSPHLPCSPVRGSCERREAPPPPPATTAQRRWTPLHRRDHPLLPIPHNYSLSLLVKFKNPCFPITAEKNTHRSTPIWSLETNNGIIRLL